MFECEECGGPTEPTIFRSVIVRACRKCDMDLLYPKEMNVSVQYECIGEGCDEVLSADQYQSAAFTKCPNCFIELGMWRRRDLAAERRVSHGNRLVRQYEGDETHTAITIIEHRESAPGQSVLTCEDSMPRERLIEILSSWIKNVEERS